LVIFGSSGGIGRCIVSIAKKYGATVYGFSRSDGVDVTVKSDVRKALNSVCQEKKRIDFIVNAAGILRVGKILDRSLDDIRGEVETNYFGCINIAMESHKYLKQSRGMLLFFTSSSHTRGRASYAIYSSTKAAIANLVQALSEEWAEDGVKINAVNPERTATPMRTANFGREHPETLLSPDFVAEKTLASLLRDYTGQIIDIKGEHPQG
jgi:2-C-methyl-D-erythritol 4-phosphate cytidylyltransferase